MKTIREYLNELPEPYRSQALRNAKAQKPQELDKIIDTMREAINHGFTWINSPEGENYWEKVWGEYFYERIKPTFTREDMVEFAVWCDDKYISGKDNEWFRADSDDNPITDSELLDKWINQKEKS